MCVCGGNHCFSTLPLWNGFPLDGELWLQRLLECGGQRYTQMLNGFNWTDIFTVFECLSRCQGSSGAVVGYKCNKYE